MSLQYVHLFIRLKCVMQLSVTLADQLIELNVPDEFIEQASDFFEKMDSDMNAGWQINREWVDQPDQYLRGQIAADKLLTALENEDFNLGRLMAGYIASRFPHIEQIQLSEQGEIRDHTLMLGSEAPVTSQSTMGFDQSAVPGGKNKIEAMAQAGKEVSSVFKMGKQYKFSVFNHKTQAWDESGAFGSKETAEQARDLAFKQRFDALTK
jgi:hypothetical protein